MNLTNIQNTPVTQLAPMARQVGVTPDAVHPSVAAKIKEKALARESMQPLRDRELRQDQAISRAGIKALLKKTPEEMSSRRMASFLSIFPGKLGRTEWSGSSHLQDIKKLADTYRKLPDHASQERLEVLQELSTALDNYGSQSAKARLGERIAGLKEFVRGEMIKLKSQMQEPGLSDLGPEIYGQKGILAEDYQAFATAAKAGNLEVLDAVVGDMTNRIVVELRDQGVDGEKFAGSAGIRLRAQLCQQIIKADPELGGLMKMPNPNEVKNRVNQALDRLYAGVVNGLNPGHGSQGTGSTLQIGTLRLVPHGTEGMKDRPIASGGAFLGRGGFGNVYLYDGSDGSKVVVKVPKEAGETETSLDERVTIEERAQLSHREAEMHALVQGEDGHENLIALKGVVHNGKNTTLCIEHCPNGGVDDLGVKLQDLDSLQGLTPDQQGKVRQLTVGLVIRDMARGLAHIHEKGVAHLDFKGGNAFIGGDGVAKVGDLGTGVRQQDGLYELPMNHQYVDNPSYLPPEMLEAMALPPKVSLSLCGARKIQALDLDAVETAYEKFSDPAPVEEFRRIKDTLLTIQTQIRNGEGDERTLAAEWERTTKRLDDLTRELAAIPGSSTGRVLDVNKVDVWGLGLTLCELAYPGGPGKSGSPFDEGALGQTAKTGDNIAQYGKDGDKTFTEYRLERWEKTHPGVLPPTDERLDALLDKMMHRDPNQRITVAQALEDPYFQELVLDNPQVREFVQKLTSSGSSRVEIEESAKLVAHL
ncbi:protein kinase [Verrucomicrobium sp. BvORR034]|uniref:protein kinase domain-containing protein n=1 Tax=Verrucomicrobium sp. BvORR034 TaxID=1396418 RepID=UPI0006790671|nr:protein kinase [Verrucomicrobium sp. BvORR034]